MISNYLKIAWRSLKRQKVFTVINLTGLAIGFACCLLIALFVWHELSYDRFHVYSYRIYGLFQEEVEGNGQARSGPQMALTLKDDFPEIESTMRVIDGVPVRRVLVSYEDETAGEIRRFNEENNEEAGEHWTPRDAVRLMTRLMFEPVADRR
jgi:putative ABC transport system permease protein